MSKRKLLRKKNTTSKRKTAPGSKMRSGNDIKSKTIFGNPVLCCQFLKNYVDHPVIKNIRPEDIEDYTERYISYFGVEFEADTVKRICIRDENIEIGEFYLISLIEHKSKVDYNVVVQLLKYMACIWAEYEKQFGMDYKEQVKNKSFRYPPILPVVYHEGSDTWTAPMHLKERIFMHEIFEDYIPDFTYCLVNNHDYSKEVLLAHEDEMSLIMLLNKIQNATDLKEFLHIPPEEINRIVKESPEAIIDIIVMVMQALCTKLNLSRQDTEECVKKVRTRDMGYLWENMEKIDVQASQAALTQVKTELADTQNQLTDTQNQLTDTQSKLTDTRSKLTDTRSKLADTQSKLADTQSKYADLENKYTDTQAEIARLKDLLAVHGIAQEEV